MRIRDRRIPGLASAAVLILLLTGCDSTGTTADEYIMRFDVGGSRVTYNHPATLVGTIAEEESQYIGIFSGFSSSSSLSLTIYSNAPIATNTTYSGYGLDGSGLVVGAVFAYQHSNGILYTQGVTGTIQSNIRLLEISSTLIRGTFSGVLGATGQPDITIANGEFTVRRL